MFNSLCTRVSGEIFGRTFHQQLSVLCRLLSHTTVLSHEGTINVKLCGRFKTIEVTTVGKVRVIGLNRPRHRNAVNRQVARELYRAFHLFDKDEDVNVAILYGKGGTFCSGYDLKEIAGAKTQLGKYEGTVGDAVKNNGWKNDQTGMGIKELLQECDIGNDFAPMVCRVLM